MDFETCFRQSRYLLLEGALGERLKREYGLKIDGPAAIAPLVTQPAFSGDDTHPPCQPGTHRPCRI